MKRHTNDGLRKVCGCPRRQWAKCPHAWHVNYKPRIGPSAGQPFRFSLDKHLGRHVDSKTKAEEEAEKIRIAIREGKFGRPAPRDDMTLRQLADTYLERYVRVERASREQAFVWALNTICRTVVPSPGGGEAPLGSWRLTDIVTDTVERFREIRRAEGAAGPGGVNRNLGSLRALFNWALKVGYADRTPFRRHSVAVVKLSAEHSRARRLDSDSDEGNKVLAACAPHLRAVVETALETGMRRGEILNLQWSQIEGLKVDDGKIIWAKRAEFVLPWTKTKTKRDRRIPISSRLKSILEMRRFGPDGEPLAADRYVFGNEIGQRVENIKRAWHTAVLKAHGCEPKYTNTANLTPESRAELARIDLHFHDLRREAGSRWLEGGVPLHTIRDWLGHTSIAQTSTYLAGTVKTQHDAMEEFERRRETLQRFATKSKTGGRKKKQAGAPANRRGNKTTRNHDQAVM